MLDPELFDYGLIFLLVYVLGVVAAVHALLTVRTSTGTVAWVISLLTIPYLTLLPYLFLSRGRFNRYVDARRAVMNEVRRHIEREEIGLVREMAEEMLVVPESGRLRTLSRLAGLPCTAHNQVRLLINGEATFAAILDAIKNAERCVIVQFYLISDDEIGRLLQQALLERQAAGVKIYLLYDGIGSYRLPNYYVNQLRIAGIEAESFTTSRGFVNPFQLNFRNHRKLVLIDGRRAFVGGHNVGDEYLGKMPPLSPWRDTHIEITGPLAASLQLVFAEDWYAATERLPMLLPPQKSESGEMLCQAIPAGPADEQETGSLMFIEAINSAYRRIWLCTPYFVPDEAIIAALRLAVLRGVDVRILLPSRADHLIVYRASGLYAYEMAGIGVKIYRYKPGFMHQKVILIDDDTALVGSANLDNRSFRLNFELMVATVDSVFAAEVEKMLLDDFLQSKLIDAKTYARVPALKRLGMSLARLFAPLL